MMMSRMCFVDVEIVHNDKHRISEERKDTRAFWFLCKESVLHAINIWRETEKFRWKLKHVVHENEEFVVV